MNRIQQCFIRTRTAGRPAFIAYLTMGYPSLAASEEAADALLANGADILELGVPFSDPVADGAVIRKAAYAALEQGVTLSDVLALAKRLRAKHSDAPLIVFSYYNVIFSYGLDKFAADAAASGVDAVLPVDLPFEERDELFDVLRPHGLTLVPLVSPTTSVERAVESAKGVEDSFLYVITVKGTTGARTELPPDLKDRLSAIRAAVNMPIAAGFGISTRKQAKMIGEVADGFVVGSALVKMLGETGRIDPSALPV
ncbi:MAG: tryptophan synthase subunit alpha [Kiritimatiellae bacterium]|nr:tryptophan synthase subunit alpha [Kiritimatiellia bacterium]